MTAEEEQGSEIRAQGSTWQYTKSVVSLDGDQATCPLYIPHGLAKQLAQGFQNNGLGD